MAGVLRALSRYFLFQHIPKAGGASFITDARGLFQECKLLHCTHAKRRIGIGRPNATCEFSACEGNIYELLYVLGVVWNEKIEPPSFVIARTKGIGVPTHETYSPEMLGRPMLVLTMIRQPTAHVRSMYAHCQQHGAIGQIQHHWDPISFEDWVGGWVEGRDMSKHCNYSPRNALVRHLVHEEEADSPDRAIDQLHRYFFVGTTERYPASLCLLAFKIDRPRFPWCSCPDGLPERQLRPRHEQHFPPERYDLHHNRHGTNSSNVMLTPRALRDTRTLTAMDQRVYDKARSELEEDLKAARLSCILDSEGQGAPG